MKNLLSILFIVSILSSFSFAAKAEPSVPLCSIDTSVYMDSQQVHFLLGSYAEIVSFYQDQIDESSLEFLSVRAAEIEAQINAKLAASQDKALRLIAQHLAFPFSQ